MKECNNCRFLGQVSYIDNVDSKVLLCINKEAKQWYDKLKRNNDSCSIVAEKISCPYSKPRTLRNQNYDEKNYLDKASSGLEGIN